MEAGNLIPYKYILFRIIAILPVVIGAFSLMFIIMRLMPADPVLMLIDPVHRTPEAIAAVRRAMGLDQPLYIQYFSYLSLIFRGDLGFSWHSGRPVMEELLGRFPATLELIVPSLIISISAGILIGIFAGAHRGKKADHILSGISLIGLSVPSYWWAIILILVFFYFIPVFPPPIGRLPMNIAPPPHVTGFYLVDSLLAGNLAAFQGALSQIVLPVATLSFINMMGLAKIQRAEMAEALESDYVKTAQAKGVSETGILFKHALKNALLPSITQIGIMFGYSLSGSVLIEIVFSWPGIGRYAVESIQYLDYSGLQGFVVIIVLAYSIINLVVDILYAVVDPRIKHGE